MQAHWSRKFNPWASSYLHTCVLWSVQTHPVSSFSKTTLERPTALCQTREAQQLLAEYEEKNRLLELRLQQVWHVSLTNIFEIVCPRSSRLSVLMIHVSVRVFALRSSHSLSQWLPVGVWDRSKPPERRTKTARPPRVCHIFVCQCVMRMSVCQYVCKYACLIYVYLFFVHSVHPAIYFDFCFDFLLVVIN